MPVNRFEESDYGLFEDQRKPKRATETFRYRNGSVTTSAAMLAARAEKYGRPISLDERLFVRPTGNSASIGTSSVKTYPSGLASGRTARAAAHVRLAPQPREPAHRTGGKRARGRTANGHSDPSVTLRVYGHLFAGAQEELTERLDRLRNSTLAEAAGGGEVIALDAHRRKHD